LALIVVSHKDILSLVAGAAVTLRGGVLVHEGDGSVKTSRLFSAAVKKRDSAVVRPSCAVTVSCT
jgi:hypothetical protein